MAYVRGQTGQMPWHIQDIVSDSELAEVNGKIEHAPGEAVQEEVPKQSPTLVKKQHHQH